MCVYVYMLCVWVSVICVWVDTHTSNCIERLAESEAKIKRSAHTLSQPAQTTLAHSQCIAKQRNASSQRSRRTWNCDCLIIFLFHVRFHPLGG